MFGFHVFLMPPCHSISIEMHLIRKQKVWVEGGKGIYIKCLTATDAPSSKRQGHKACFTGRLLFTLANWRGFYRYRSIGRLNQTEALLVWAEGRCQWEITLRRRAFLKRMGQSNLTVCWIATCMPQCAAPCCYSFQSYFWVTSHNKHKLQMINSLHGAIGSTYNWAILAFFYSF